MENAENYVNEVLPLPRVNRNIPEEETPWWLGVVGRVLPTTPPRRLPWWQRLLIVVFGGILVLILFARLVVPQVNPLLLVAPKPEVARRLTGGKLGKTGGKVVGAADPTDSS